MSVPTETGHPYGAAAAAASELDLRRDELTARLRAARAVLSPKAAVAAAASSGDTAEAAALQSSVDQAKTLRSGFQPRSMTMKLILERPDVTLRVIVAIATLLFGARLATQFGSAAAMVSALRKTLGAVDDQR